MAEQSLLNMVQNILSSLDSDEVNSIGDTVESRQVAQIIENKYYDMVSRGFFPEHNRLLQLDPSLDPTRPTLMFIPQGVSKIWWIKYFDSNVLEGSSGNQLAAQFGAFSHDLNTDLTSTPSWTTTSSTSHAIGLGSLTFTVADSGLTVAIGQGVVIQPTGSTTVSMQGTLISYSGTTMTIAVTSTAGVGTFTNWTITGGGGFISAPGYKYVTNIPTEQFLDMTNRFNPSSDNVAQYQFNQAGHNFTFYYKTDMQPSWCTILSYRYVIFDSFDQTQDDTLQSSKTMCLGQVVVPFVMSDSFIPPLDDQEFPLLLNEAKALAWVELKQTPHVKAEQEASRQWVAIQKVKSVSEKPSYFEQLPDFGRVPRTGGFAGGGYGAYRWMRQSGP